MWCVRRLAVEWEWREAIGTNSAFQRNTHNDTRMVRCASVCTFVCCVYTTAAQAYQHYSAVFVLRRIATSFVFVVSCQPKNTKCGDVFLFVFWWRLNAYHRSNTQRCVSHCIEFSLSLHTSRCVELLSVLLLFDIYLVYIEHLHKDCIFE